MNKHLILAALAIVVVAFVVVDRPSPTMPVAAQTLPTLSDVLDRAETLQPLETVIIAQGGTILAERGYRGHSVTAATNIKSASKSVISALVGIAIDKGLLEGP